MKGDDHNVEGEEIKVRIIFKLCSNTSINPNILVISDESAQSSGRNRSDQGKIIVLECFQQLI